MKSRDEAVLYRNPPGFTELLHQAYGIIPEYTGEGGRKRERDYEAGRIDNNLEWYDRPWERACIFNREWDRRAGNSIGAATSDL